MNLKDIGASTSGFGYAMGSTGKNTERKNPTPWTIEEFVEFAHVQGFGGIEAPLMRFIPDLNPERLATLKSMLDERGMFFVLDSEAALDVEQIHKLIPVAKQFNSPIIRIKSSNVLGLARATHPTPWSDHVEHCIEVLKSLAPALREQGLRIALENHQDLDSNDLLRIVDAVGSDVVGVTFDIGNAFASCEDPLVFAQKLGSRIINIHLKEYKVVPYERGFRLVRCPLGEGAVDFKTVLPILARQSPDAKMIVELGALDARLVARQEPGFWEHIAPRNPSELAAFSAILNQKGESIPTESWQTPWEKGAPASDIVTHEVEELQVSARYLATI